MAKTRISTKQKTLTSWFRVSKTNLCAEKDPNGKPGMENQSKAERNQLKNSKISQNPDGAIKNSKNLGRSRKKAPSSRNRKPDLSETRSSRTRGFQNKSCLVDLALSCKDTEAFSEIPKFTVRRQNLFMESVSSKVPIRRGKRQRSSKHSPISRDKRCRNATKSRLRAKRSLKIKSITLRTNNSTMTASKVAALAGAEIPKLREFSVYNEADVFGTMLEKYTLENSEIENDCDTDEEEQKHAYRRMIRRLNCLPLKVQSRLGM